MKNHTIFKYLNFYEMFWKNLKYVFNLFINKKTIKFK